MQRRDFLGVLSGAVVGWPPLAARAQRADKIHRIGYLGLASATAQATRMNAFRAGLAALGYIEGKNIVIEERRIEGRQYEQLGTLAGQLVDLKVDVIVTHAQGVSASMRATSTTPIVAASIADAVASGPCVPAWRDRAAM